MRTARCWAVLAALAAVVAATLQGSALAEGLAGLACAAVAVTLVRLDSQRKRGGARR